MHTDQYCYRRLYEQLLAHDGPDPFKLVVEGWLSANREECEWASSFASDGATQTTPIAVETSWRLYALSRIVDLVIPCSRAISPSPAASLDFSLRDQAEFMHAFACTRVNLPEFHPFWHEIVAVETLEDPDAPIDIVGEPLWPCWMLGPSMLLRAGVRVRGGSNLIVSSVAENCPLYWTFRRLHRTTADASMGWGSHSQWRTSFRRDVCTGDALHYNVDAGETSSSPMEAEQYTREDIREIVRHRSFIRCQKPGDDLWPYNESLVEERPGMKR